MTHDIMIRQGMLTVIDRSPGDVTALPADASLISEADWIALADEYGSEGALMNALGVTEDARQEGEWRYVPGPVAEDELGEY